MKLTEAAPGGTYTVRELSLPPRPKRQLEILGMTAGCRIQLLNRKGNGAVIIRLRTTRFALGRAIACGIELGGDRHGA